MMVLAGGGDEQDGLRTRCCSYEREFYASQMRRSSGLNRDHAGDNNNSLVVIA